MDGARIHRDNLHQRDLEQRWLAIQLLSAFFSWSDAMKLMDFDGSEFLSVNDIEFIESDLPVRRSSPSRDNREWWDEEDAPRRVRCSKVRRFSRDVASRKEL